MPGSHIANSELLFDDIKELADGLNTDELIIRDADIESLFEFTDDLKHDERVESKIDDDTGFLKVVEVLFGDLTCGCFEFIEKF